MEATIIQQTKTPAIEKRVKGAAIDIFMCWISMHILGIIPNLLLGQLFDLSNPGSIKAYFFLTGLFQIGYCGVYYVAPILMEGKTVGKYFTKTKIVSTNGKPLDRNQILKRELVGKPLGILTFTAFQLFKEPNQKSPWDTMSETMVVDEE